MKQIGRYQVVGDLGKGAMGVVYRAVDPAIGRTVAIKTIRLQDLGDDAQGRQMRERLFREARSAGVLSHPNIVTIYDIAEVEGNAYIFMEFVDGPSLDKLVRADPAPNRELLLRLLTEVASALDYAHSRGIVHRDVKPPNILVQEGVTAKIADFGVARIESHQATQAGTIVGTPNYMSPEQIQGETVDGKADQYSLAVIAYELLTGEKPFVADSMPTLLFKIIRDQPEPAQRLNPSLNEPVGAVLQKALNKSRENRYPNCRAFMDALAQALHSAPEWQALAPGTSLNMPTVMGAVDVPEAVASSTEAPSVLPVPASPAIRTARLDEEEDEAPGARSRWRLAIPVLLALLAGLGLWAWSSRHRSPPPQTVAAPAAVAQQQPATTVPPVVPDPAKPTVIPPESKPPAAVPEAPPKTVPKAVAASKEVNFQFITSPPGAKVVFDGSPDRSCTTPCSLSLSTGSHVLSARLDGYRPVVRRFTLPADSEVTQELERPSGKLFVRSTPAGAQVFVDGQLQPGRTPVSLTLGEGNHEIRVIRDGAPPYTTNVAVRDQGLANLEISLGGTAQ